MDIAPTMDIVDTLNQTQLTLASQLQTCILRISHDHPVTVALAATVLSLAETTRLLNGIENLS